MHTGYALSCYGNQSYVFSAPISITKVDVQKMLKRNLVINGDPLTQKEVSLLKNYVLGKVEIGWDEHLDFFIEGRNLPDNSEEWI